METTKHALRIGPILLGLLAASVAQGGAPPDYNAYYDARPLASAANSAVTARFPVTIAARDERRGVPTMLWAHPSLTPTAPGATAEEAARWYLAHHAPLYRLSRAALEAAHVHRVHDTGRGGIIVVFRQRAGGVDLARTELDVLMTRDLRLVAITGNLHEVSGDRAVRAGFRLDAAGALAGALDDLYGVALSASSVRQPGTQHAGYRHLDLAPGGAAARAGIRLHLPARTRAVYFPLADRLVPAFYVELLATRAGDDGDHGHAYVVAADDGRVLYRQTLLADDVYRYRVWAESGGRNTPLDGPQADFTPHPAGEPDGVEPAFVPPAMIAMDGFNSNPAGAVDPWLPPGAMATAGNNVDAYADHFAPDGFTPGLDMRGAITGPGVFDHVFDTAADPLGSAAQIQAVIVQIFYVTNWLHDYFYDSGFDEAAGNAQRDNYGRGGRGGDALRAEAQDRGPDASVRNNANMFTPEDGMAPRMQMYLWSTPDVERTFAALGRRFVTGTASFGSQRFALSGALALADDGTGTPTDGCEPLQGDVAGAIVLVDRGGCGFAHKAQMAEQGGAAGMVLVDNVPDAAPPGMGNGNPPLEIGIPVLSISLEDGRLLREALASGADEGVEAKMVRALGVERDGTIDNGIVAHEWGHFIHHRLVACATPQCRAQSEGWGDFLALHMMVREGDDYDGTFAAGIYATLRMGDNGYFGIRRVPYSSDLAKNALMFRHIADGAALPGEHPMRAPRAPNSEVHNAGEVWATMLFDGYTALLRESRRPRARYDFEEARRRMADYVVAGMILAPVDPTFTEQRDAILAAALARDAADMRLLARAFARRGAGTCAASPARDAADLAGVVEDLDVRGDMRLGAVVLDDDVSSCDGDGVLDAGEAGTLSITVHNPGVLPLRGTTVSVSAETAGVVFPAGVRVHLAEVAPLSAATVAVPIGLDAAGLDAAGRAAAAGAAIALAITLDNPEACEPTVTRVQVARGDYDLAPSTVETAESHLSSWEQVRLGGFAGQVWAAAADARGQRVWHGENAGVLSDVALVSPPLVVGDEQDLAITFVHRYAFESTKDAGTGQVTHWDGGVLEISFDDGLTWADAGAHATPGYGGTIYADGANPLAGRAAFVRHNPGWPAVETVTMRFGAETRGRVVRLRFRIATDRLVGAHGWEVDDIAVQGIVNRPFWSVVADASTCAPGDGVGPDAGAEMPDEGAEPGEDEVGSPAAPESSNGRSEARAGGCSIVASGVASGDASGARGSSHTFWLVLLCMGLALRRRRSAL